jgi:hypothetical protein
MIFSEADLHRVTGRAGWIASREALSEDQLDSLRALVKPPIISEWRADFRFWLNEFFAQYVESLTRRAHMLQTLSQYSLPARWMAENSHVRRPKLSTLARDELQKVERALRRAESVLDRLSPETEVEIRASFWRNRFVGRPRAGQALRFRQTWQMADDHFLRLQAACERMEGRKGHLSAQMRRELKAVVAVFDRLRVKIEDLTTVSRDALEQAYARSTANAVDPTTEDSMVEDPLDHARSRLNTLGAAFERTQIRVDRGRDEAPERALVAALAELYSITTGKEPRRTHRTIETSECDILGETGDFLELVRVFVGYANAVLPEGVTCGTRSLSKIVRQELRKRKHEGIN